MENLDKSEQEQLNKTNFANRVINITFEKKEIAIIFKCSLWMKLISFLFNVVTVILVLLTVGVLIIGFSSIGNQYMLLAGIFYLIYSVLSIILGRTLFKSARAFQDVINTAIDDQGFLVKGFSELWKFFLLLGTLIITIIIMIITVTVIWIYASSQNGI